MRQSTNQPTNLGDSLVEGVVLLKSNIGGFAEPDGLVVIDEVPNLLLLLTGLGLVILRGSLFLLVINSILCDGQEGRETSLA